MLVEYTQGRRQFKLKKKKKETDRQKQHLNYELFILAVSRQNFYYLP